jgi:hypothetical protein
MEEIIAGTRDRKGISPLDYLVALGFDGEKLLPLLSRLPFLLEKLLEPFLSTGPWYADKWNVSSQLEEILQEEAWWFRTAGPPWFLWFMRSGQGLFAALAALQVSVPFQSIYYEVLNRLDLQRWKKIQVRSQLDLLQKHQLNEIHFKHEAQHFCIKVTEGEAEIVSLQFPIQVIQELENLVTDEIRSKIASQGHNLHQIKCKIIKAGLLKGTVLDFKLDRRHYRFWLQ